MIKAYNITVSGRVQNVGFRYATMQKAKELGVKGFVKNMANGDVYIEAEGEEENLALFLLWCKTGPPHARVVNTHFTTQPVTTFDTFEIRR